MNHRFQYNNDIERGDILLNNADKALVGEENITDGDFLIFSDIEPIPTTEMITIPQSEYEALQNQLLLSENKNVEGGIF